MEYLTVEQAAAYLGTIGYPITVGTLNWKRSQGGGPKFLKNRSRRVIYTKSELRIWAEENRVLVSSTSEYEALCQVI